MKKALKIIISLICVVVAAAVLYAILHKPALPEMTTAIADAGTVTQTIDLSGNLVYPQTRQVAFPQSGKVDGVYVTLGQTVFQGDILAAFASTSFKQPNGETSIISGTSITAPIDGIVTSVLINPDDYVAAGVPVIVISGPTRNFQVVASVPESSVVALSTQDFDANITVDALPGVVFNGRVTSISPSAIPVQGVVNYQATVIITSVATDGKGGFDDLKAGMSATVDVITKQLSNVISVPARAVLTHDDGSKYVRVISDNQDVGYDERTVTTGLKGDNGNVVITDGLAAGEQVVLSIKK